MAVSVADRSRQCECGNRMFPSTREVPREGETSVPALAMVWACLHCDHVRWLFPKLQGPGAISDWVKEYVRIHDSKI